MQDLNEKLANAKNEIEQRIADLGLQIDRLHVSIQALSTNSLKLLSEITSENFQVHANLVEINLRLSDDRRITARNLQTLRDTLSKALLDEAREDPAKCDLMIVLKNSGKD
jgi:hypothetical protein